ncbi:MAG: response regulator [Spartobacteria bacterium]|nr:response regulator [Spartobacteria bacterium]
MNEDELIVLACEQPVAEQIIDELRKCQMYSFHFVCSADVLIKYWEELSSDRRHQARLIVDYRLPGLGALDALRYLRRRWKWTGPSYVLASAYERQVHETELVHSGLSGVVEKPVSRKMLRQLFSQAETTGRVDSSLTDRPVILLAEDNATNQLISSIVIKTAGYKLIVAENGFEAVELAACQRVDMVLMDLDMPWMDGWEASRLIHESSPDVPIVAMTGCAKNQVMGRCRSVGIVDAIAKTLDVNQLHTLMDTYGCPAVTFVEKECKPDASAFLSSQMKSLMEPVMDIASVEQRYAANHGLFRVLLRNFEKEYIHTDSVIEQLIAQEQWVDARHQVHALIGVCGNLGARRLSELARELDTALRHEHREHVLRLRGSFAAAFRQLIAVISALIVLLEKEYGNAATERPQSESVIQGSADDYLSYMEALRAGLKTRQPKACQSIFTRWRGYKWTVIQQRQIDYIKECLSAYRFDEGLAVIETLSLNAG